MSLADPLGPESALIHAWLAAAKADIGANRLVDAAAQYQACLNHPALDKFPAARVEILANYGVLLLQRARRLADAQASEPRLNAAIAMLGRARIGALLSNDAPLRAIIDANLALAYLERDQVAGRHADLVSAQLALDRAETALDPTNSDLRAWTQSIRDTLSKRTERQRQSR